MASPGNTGHVKKPAVVVVAAVVVDTDVETVEAPVGVAKTVEAITILPKLHAGTLLPGTA